MMTWWPKQNLEIFAGAALFLRNLVIRVLINSRLSIITEPFFAHNL